MIELLMTDLKNDCFLQYITHRKRSILDLQRITYILSNSTTTKVFVVLHYQYRWMIHPWAVKCFTETKSRPLEICRLLVKLSLVKQTGKKIKN